MDSKDLQKQVDDKFRGFRKRAVNEEVRRT